MEAVNPIPDVDPVPGPQKEKKKRQRKRTVEYAASMLKNGNVQGAMSVLDELMAAKKKRKPSAFNLFVKETMGIMKGNGMTVKEKLAECCRLWRIQKQ